MSGMACLVSMINEELAQGLNQINIDARVSNIRSLREQTKSHIFVCAISGLDRNLIVKIIKDPHPFGSIESQAKLEFDALRKLYSINIGDDFHLCPKVYPIMIDRGAVVMEYIEGPALTQYLLDIKVPVRQKILTLEKAGKWITTVHDHFSSGKGVVPHEKIMNNIRIAIGHKEPDGNKEKAFRILDGCQKLLDNISIDITRLHGDFKTDNLIVSGNNLVGIDTRLAHTAISFRDIAYFINQLDLLFYQPKGLCLRWFLRSQFHTAFLKGVRGIWLPEQYFALLWMRLAAILMVWANSNSTLRKNPRRHYLDFVYRHLTKQLSRQLMRCLSIQNLGSAN